MICLFILLLQAYVQQLESSRIKLTQLEQELQRARSQVRLIAQLMLLNIDRISSIFRILASEQQCYGSRIWIKESYSNSK